MPSLFGRLRLRSAAIALTFAIGITASGASAIPESGSACPAANPAFARWIRTSPKNERSALDRWCAAVGPPLRVAGLDEPRALGSRFAVVSWNTHVGAADLDGFVADLRAGRLTGGETIDGFVLLLQETYRAGRDVPAASLPDLLWASVQQPPRFTGLRADVGTIATRLRLHAIYVPSMRNGAPLATDEDRGNAMLATVPLSDVTAIELPLERQRRIAIQAVVNAAGVPITIVDAHFTNAVMHHLWLLSESGRYRQARALAAVLPVGPLIVGGDFNSWFGFGDAAYREMAKVARPADVQDRRASFGLMRLDHLLFRLPDGWRTTLRRADSRYGSDHYPLVATVTAGG